MKADEIISKAEVFANEFIAKLKDTQEQPERKQVYFLDNQDALKKYLGALQKIVISVGDDENANEDDAILALKAEAIIDDIKQAISDYQKELIVSEDVSEEDTTVSLTQETISDAMKNNKTTKDIAANMDAINKQKQANSLYNYALVCDGDLTMINAATKDELNNTINTVANTGSFKDIQLYKVQFTPVQLKKKTVLSV